MVDLTEQPFVSGTSLSNTCPAGAVTVQVQSGEIAGGRAEPAGSDIIGSTRVGASGKCHLALALLA